LVSWDSDALRIPATAYAPTLCAMPLLKMRLLIILTLIGLPFYGQTQTTIDHEIIACITDSFKQEKVDIKATLDSFESFLVDNKYMSDKSGQSYISLYKKIAAENDVNITLDNFNDNGLLQISPNVFVDCYRTGISGILNSDSPLKKLYKHFQDNPIEPTSPGEVSEHLLKVFKPTDFKHDVIRFYSLYTFLRTSYSGFSVQSTLTDEQFNLTKKYEKKVTVRLDKESKLFLHDNPTSFEDLTLYLDKVLTPSVDTLKSVNLESSRETRYKDFTTTLQIIQNRFQIARDKISQSEYNQNFDSLTDDKKEIVRRLLPIKINVADPK
jgi:biopolymer transport protein ExbD